MQIMKGYANDSAFTVAKSIWHQEGVKGFFRGCVPPLWGSMVYRGIMMSGYEYSFTALDKNFSVDSFMKSEIGGGLRPMVVCSAIFASLTRAVLESMFRTIYSNHHFHCGNI